MTQRLQFPLFILIGLIAGALAAKCLAAALGVAFADPVAQVDAGPFNPEDPTTPPPPTVEPPHGVETVPGRDTSTPPIVDNPVTNPGEAFDDLKAARKIGWPALVIVGLTMVLLALGSIFPTRLGPLARGSVAFVFSCFSTGALAAGNAALDGGSWVALGTAGVLAAFGVWKADRDAAARERALKAAA
jgi:hypothetical protein